MMDGWWRGRGTRRGRVRRFRGENTPNTLGHLAQAVGGLQMPTFHQLGLGNILPLEGVPPAGNAARLLRQGATPL